MGFYLNIYSTTDFKVIKSGHLKFIQNQIFTFKSQIIIDESKSLNPLVPQKGSICMQKPFHKLSFLKSEF
jgi:hypothetical protein